MHLIAIWKLIRNFGLIALWAVVVALMYRNYLLDPPDPTRQGSATFGHNIEGEFERNVIFTTVELAVLYLILRPWSYHRSWWRSLSALVLFAPWTCLLFAILHVGGTTNLQLFWLMAVELTLLITTVVSGLTAVWDRYGAR